MSPTSLFQLQGGLGVPFMPSATAPPSKPPAAAPPTAAPISYASPSQLLLPMSVPVFQAQTAVPAIATTPNPTVTTAIGAPAAATATATPPTNKAPAAPPAAPFRKHRAAEDALRPSGSRKSRGLL